MPDRLENNYQEWFKKADEDELSAGVILKEGGVPSTACFLSQQMAEKYLKGLLVFYNKKFPKIHDLFELETLLIDISQEIQEYHDDLELLNRYYIETRYPGDYPELNLIDAEEALESAKRIKEFVLDKVKKIKPCG